MAIFKVKEKSHGAHIWLLSNFPEEKIDWPTHLLNILHLERSYLIHRLSGRTWARHWLGNGKLINSGMMFNHATLRGDACHFVILYQFTRFLWSQNDALHSIWRRKKDFSLYSTTHLRAFGFGIMSFFLFLFIIWRMSFGIWILGVICFFKFFINRLIRYTFR